MTKNEIATLDIGSKLELADGSIAEVRNIDRSDKTVTFEYVAPLTATASGMDGALGGFMGPKYLSADGAISPAAPPVTPPVALKELKTTVRCKWVELANVLKV